MLNCPKAAAYETGLCDAIETIRKTKNAFKSRELGALRKRLEALLNPNLVDQTSHQSANLSGHTLLPTIEGHVSDPPQNLDR